MRMTTPVTARNGVDVKNSGIRTCSFIANCLRWGDDEVATGDGDDLHDAAGRDLGVRRGGHVVRRAGEADEHGSEVVGRNPDRDPAGRPDHVLEVEGRGGLGLAQDLEGAEDHARAEQSRDDAGQGGSADADAHAVQPEQAAHPEHGDEPEQQRCWRDPGDVEAQVNGPEEPAEDVVDDQGEQEEAAPQQQAHSEYEVSGAHAPTTSACSLGRLPLGRSRRGAIRRGTLRSPAPRPRPYRPCSGSPRSRYPATQAPRAGSAGSPLWSGCNRSWVGSAAPPAPGAPAWSGPPRGGTGPGSGGTARPPTGRPSAS